VRRAVPGTPGEPEALTLSPPEVSVLRRLRKLGPGQFLPEDDLARQCGLSADATRGACERLRAKRLVIRQETPQRICRLTPRGEEGLRDGLPERRLLTLLQEGPRNLAEISRQLALTPEEISAGIGQLKRQGLLEVGEVLRLTRPVAGPLPEEEGLREASQGRVPADEDLTRRLLRRGLIILDQRTLRSWRASPEGEGLPLEKLDRPSVSSITSDMLRSGSWRDLFLRPYDMRAEVPRVLGARSHPYRAWLREFEELLVGMGFEEFRSPVVDLEFYNSDALFIPQEHPARSLHDLLVLEGVEGRTLPEKLLRPVRAAHEGNPLPRQRVALSRGWQTPFREDMARRVILRSHTTAASVHYLLTHPKPPFRMYSLDTVFRRDEVDATHHFQFEQCEGVLGKRGTNLRHLFGFFQQVAEAVGIREIRFRPAYFPFTEPSVEGYVRHPTLGWLEIFPGGMLRPEVLRPLGIRVPVAAWGIGVTRLATIALGTSDLRDFFGCDLAALSSWRA
jgi:phenylalanyl-tRNA synthetase alpha chain